MTTLLAAVLPPSRRETLTDTSSLYRKDVQAIVMPIAASIVIPSSFVLNIAGSSGSMMFPMPLRGIVS